MLYFSPPFVSGPKLQVLQPFVDFYAFHKGYYPSRSNSRFLVISRTFPTRLEVLSLRTQATSKIFALFPESRTPVECVQQFFLTCYKFIL